MKKIFATLFLFTLFFTNTLQVKSMTYEEAIVQSKPIALFVYSTWADEVDKVKENFNALEGQFGNTYNFVSMDIASEDTKEFNKKYPIYTNLPYVLLFKDRGKVSRYIQKNCILDSSCFTEKLKLFAN